MRVRERADVDMFRIGRKARQRAEERARAEQEHDALLAQAETDLASLTARGEHAVQFLVGRNRRNHWRESIEQMIQGVN